MTVKGAEQLTVHDGGWISPARLMRLIEKAKKHASKVSFSSISHGTGIPKLLDCQLGVGKEGADGKPAPITPKDWSTLVLPWLESLGVLTEDIKKQYEEARVWADEHPRAATLLVLVVSGVLIVLFAYAYPELSYKPILKAMGFTSKGVSKSSIASEVQSWIGNIAQGSTFARIQSATMGGVNAFTLADSIYTGAKVTVSGVSAGLGIKTLKAKL